MYGVTIQELIDKMKMKNVTPEIDVEKIVLTHPDVNRPALQLAGFFDHFDKDRVQISADGRCMTSCWQRRFLVWYTAAARCRMRICWSCATITMYHVWFPT